MNTQKIELFFANAAITHRAQFVQGDTDGKIICNVKDMEIAPNTYARVYCLKPSGLSIFNDCEIDGQSITIECTSQMLAEVGDTICQVQISEGGKTTTSHAFLLVVNERVVDREAIESSNEFSALDNALNAVDGVNTRLTTVEKKEATDSQNIASLTTSVSNLNATTKETSELTGELKTEQDKHTSRLTALETSDKDHGDRIDGIEAMLGGYMESVDLNDIKTTFYGYVKKAQNYPSSDISSGYLEVLTNGTVVKQRYTPDGGARSAEYYRFYYNKAWTEWNTLLVSLTLATQNLNYLTTSMTGYVSSATNAPSGWSGGFIDVKATGSIVVQKFTTSTAIEFVRYQSGTTWTAWKQVVTQ